MKKSYLFATLIALFYLILFVLIPHNEVLPADPGLKIIQVKEFIESSFSTFYIQYPAHFLDPDYKFYPLKYPFAFPVHGKIHIVFPFYMTLFYTPFYMMGGVRALVFLSLLSSMGVLFVLYRISKIFKIEGPSLTLMIIFYAFGSFLPAYSIIPNEMPIAALLISAGVLLILKGVEKESYHYLFPGGLLCGISALFRVETALFSVLLQLFIFVFPGIWKRPFRALWLFFGLSAAAMILILGNYFVEGHILGLRGVKFSDDLEEVGMLSRLSSYLDYFLLSKHGPGLLLSWPIEILFLATPFLYKRNPTIHFLFYTTFLYSLILPVAVTNDAVSIWGPRYLYPVQSFVVLLSFLSLGRVLELTEGKRWVFVAAKGAVAYSLVISFFVLIIVYNFVRESKNYNEVISRKLNGSVIILKDWAIYGVVLSSFRTRPILAANDDEEYTVILDRCQSKGIENISVVSEPTQEVIPSTETGYKVVDHFKYKGVVVTGLKLLR